MPYPNATNLTAINSTKTLFTVTNDISGGVYGSVVSLAIYGLLVVGSYTMAGGQSRRALVGASFASFIVNLLMVQIGMLNGFVASIPLVIFGISLIVG